MQHLRLLLLLLAVVSVASFSQCPCVDQCLYATSHYSSSVSDPAGDVLIKLIQYGKYSCSIAATAPSTCPSWDNTYLDDAFDSRTGLARPECFTPGECQWPINRNSTKRACICDPATSRCVPNSVISALLSKKQATYVGLIISALPALAITVLIIHELLQDRPFAFFVFYALINEALNLGTTIVYFFASQYANTLLFGLSIGFVCAPLLVYFYHCTYTLKDNALYKALSFDVALKDSCDSLGNFLMSQWNTYVGICVTLIGTLLWKAEVLIVPSVFQFWTGERMPPSASVPLFSANLYHKRMLSTLLLDSAPSLAIQVYNNILLAKYGMYGWDKFAIVSAAFSGASIVNSLYGSAYTPIKQFGLNFSRWEMPDFNPINGILSMLAMLSDKVAGKQEAEEKEADAVESAPDVLKAVSRDVEMQQPASKRTSRA